MSIIFSVVPAVSSGSWFIALRILTLYVAMMKFFLHVSRFGLGFVADFSNAPGFLAGPSGIRAGWVLETKSRLGTE